MNKLLIISVLFLFLLPVKGAELLLADATGGAPLEAVFRASVTLALQSDLEVSMKRMDPSKALAELDKGSVDAVVIDSVFAANRNVVPLACEALALYVSSANPGAALTKKQVGEILRSPRPSWVEYNRINLDIQRIMMKPLSPSGTLVRRIFGNDAAAEEIFKVDSFSSGFTFINTASIFFAQYIPQAPVEVKCLPIGGVLPTSADIISGKYPLSVRYVIAYKENSARLQLLLKELKKDKYRTQMANSGLIVL
ncbi:MAG: hypothetical protein E7051_06750 [Lentisphaerae bacterium]|nr:hypothetical protein [Lentisphaerota bacterium]